MIVVATKFRIFRYFCFCNKLLKYYHEPHTLCLAQYYQYSTGIWKTPTILKSRTSYYSTKILYPVSFLCPGKVLIEHLWITFSCSLCFVLPDLYVFWKNILMKQQQKSNHYYPYLLNHILDRIVFRLFNIFYL